MPYNRSNAVKYAHEWAYRRNPDYYNFDGVGGDCTNFISQCLFAGGALMNPKKTMGWYYHSVYDRAPAWSSVQFLYNFLVHNKEIGPTAREIGMEQITHGDLIQLSFKPDVYSHSLLVVQTGELPNLDNILIATHTEDSDYRPLSSYNVMGYRYLKVND